MLLSFFIRLFFDRSKLKLHWEQVFHGLARADLRFPSSCSYHDNIHIYKKKISRSISFRILYYCSHNYNFRTRWFIKWFNSKMLFFFFGMYTGSNHCRKKLRNPLVRCIFLQFYIATFMPAWITKKKALVSFVKKKLFLTEKLPVQIEFLANTSILYSNESITFVNYFFSWYM